MNLDFRASIESMSDVAAGQLLKAIYAYADGEETPEMSQIVNLAFQFFAPQIKADIEQTAKRAAANKENGSKGGRPKKADDSARKDIPYDEIVGYLNEKTGKRFTAKNKDTIKHINGRWDDGYKVDDFKHVIDVKCSEWLGDSKMEQFLRPSTLFRPSHFENYLNQRVIKKVVNSSNKFHNFKQRDWDFDELERQLDTMGL